MLNIIVVRPVKTEYVIKEEKSEMEKFMDHVRRENDRFETELMRELDDFEAFKRH